MSILNKVYALRKRMTDKHLLELQEMIQNEIKRREENDARHPHPNQKVK